jgi:hypothetical protein
VRKLRAKERKETHVLPVDISTNCHWPRHLEHVWLGTEQLRRVVENVQRMFLGQASLTKEMVPEDADIGLCPPKVVLYKELCIGETVSGGMRNLAVCL